MFICVKILQQDEESLSPKLKTEVSPVSQAWFTTKEDKDTLANEGTHNLHMTQMVSVLNWIEDT